MTSWRLGESLYLLPVFEYVLMVYTATADHPSSSNDEIVPIRLQTDQTVG